MPFTGCWKGHILCHFKVNDFFFVLNIYKSDICQMGSITVAELELCGFAVVSRVAVPRSLVSRFFPLGAHYFYAHSVNS